MIKYEVIGWILMWALCTYFTYAAVKHTKFVECFNIVNPNGGIVAAFFIIFTVCIPQVMIVTSRSDRHSEQMQLFLIAGLILFVIESVCLIKTWKSEKN